MRDKLKKAVLSVFCLMASLTLVYCPNPVATLSSLDPDTKVYHMPSFILTAHGADFSSSSVIVFNGVQKQTVFVANSELTCQIDPGEISTAPASIPVLVRDTASGEDSNALNFAVREHHVFSTPVLASPSLSLNCGVSRSAKIGVDDEKNVNLVWGECDPVALEGYVYFIRSEDLGLTWINLHELPDPNWLGNFYPAIAIDKSQNINVVYAKQTLSSGTYDLFFIRSQEGQGQPWTVPLNLTPFFMYSKYSDIGIGIYNNTENIGVVFNSYGGTSKQDIYFMSSSNNGVAWSVPVQVNATSTDSGLVRMAVDNGGGISVVWLDALSYPNSKVMYNHSPDFGVTWGTPIAISPNNAMFRWPDVEVGDSGYVYAVWVEQTYDNLYSVVFRSSDDYGITWGSPMYLADNPNTWVLSVLAADTAGNVYLYYYNDNGCFVRRSVDHGATWESPIQIPVPSGSYGDIVLDDEGNIYLTITAGGVNFVHSIQ